MSKYIWMSSMSGQLSAMKKLLCLSHTISLFYLLRPWRERRSPMAVNRWRAPGKSAVIIAIGHGTSAALKGNVRWRSDWFIARYAQTTPISNVATSDQPLLDLRQAQSHLSRRPNSNHAGVPPTKLLALSVFILAFQIVKIGPIIYLCIQVQLYCLTALILVLSPGWLTLLIQTLCKQRPSVNKVYKTTGFYGVI